MLIGFMSMHGLPVRHSLRAWTCLVSCAAAVVLLLGSGMVTFAQTCSTPSFKQPPVFPVGNDIRAIAAGDFDGDGKPDLAVVNVNSNNITVVTKTTDTPPVLNTYAVGAFPLSIGVGDFNSDGRPDLVVGNNSDSTVSLLLNTGTGFSSGGAFPAGGPIKIVVGDFNGDTKADVAGVAMGNIFVLPGDGSGGFGATIYSDGDGDHVAAADFNNDGKLDLAVSNGTIKIFFGDGAGHFTEGSCTAGSGQGTAANDLNGDGKIDLVVADVLAARVHVRLGDGTGCFAAPFDINVFNAGNPSFVSLGDLNNDGKLDIVAGTAVMLGNGNGTFGSAVYHGIGSFGPEPGPNNVLADFDRDGKLDLAMAGNGSAGILFGDGAGAFRYEVGPNTRGAFGLAQADLNADGKLDVVAVSGSNLVVMLGDGTGNFSAPAPFQLPGFTPIGPLVADFTGDSKLDIAGLENGRLDVLPGDGMGSFGAVISTNFNASQPQSMAKGDFNGDGKVDVMTVNQSGGNNLEGSISVALGDGAGHFGPATSFSARTSPNSKSVGVADFNGDGKIDLAIPAGFGFNVLLGDGSGSFGPRNLITTAQATAIAVADLNGDGKQDLAMVGFSTPGLNVVLGDGAGGFGPPVQYTVGGDFSQDLVLADFNGDNKLDVAIADQQRSAPGNPLLSYVSVLLGDGAAGFGAPSHFRTDRVPSQVIAGDFSSDGRPDVITSNASVNNLSVLVNMCSGPATIQLSAASYAASEGQNFLAITVTRSGDTSGAAMVKYATSDATDVNFVCNPSTSGQITGAASRKCDYHIAVGRLRFAAGETSKQIILSIVNDVYVEPSESLTITLSSPSAAVLGTTSSATINITDNDTSGQANPIDGTGFYVRMLYVDLLSREPEPAGLAGWVHRIDFCGQPGEPPPPCDRVTVGGDGFLRSAEFFDREFFVIRLYRTALGRILRYDDVGDLAFVSGFLTDADLELNKQDLVNEIMGRPEFGNIYNGMSNAQYVDSMISTAAVTLPAGIRDGWVNALNGATKTRAQVFRELSERAEVSAKYLHEAQVISCYYGFFTRNPDGAYFTFLQRYDNGEITLGDLANAFINAAEYRQRFGP